MDKRKGKSKNIGFLTCILINIIILPFLLVMLIFQQIVNLYLKLKNGKQYAGLMKTWDAINLLIETPEAPNIPFAIFEIEPSKCDENGTDNSILQTARYGFDNGIKIYKSLEKLTYSKHVKFGYPFWKRIENFDINNHIKRIELQEGQTIEDFASKIVSKSIVEGIWELLICDKVSGEQNKLYMIMRAHHSLGDGLSIFQMLTTCLFNSEKLVQENSLKKQSFWNVKTFKWPCYVYRNLSFSNHTSVIHPQRLSHNKSVVWSFDENETVLKVKGVKNSIPGLTFSGVVHTAISVALYRYIEKYKGKENIPEFIYINTARQIPGFSFDTTNPENIALELQTLSDALFLKLVSPDLPMKEKLETVCKDLNDFERGESMVIYNAFKLLSPLICPFTKTGTLRFEMTTSNLPGFSKLEVDGRKITNMAISPNNMYNIGLTMGIKSYGKKLNLAMIFDKAILKTEEEAKDILKNIYEEIVKMYKSLQT